MALKLAVDFEHLKKYTAGDAQIEDEILGIFVQQAEIWVRNLNDSQETKAWLEAAHSLKGSARGIGAWAVAELCEHAEALASQGSPEERSIVLGDLKIAMEDVVRCIETRETVVG